MNAMLSPRSFRWLLLFAVALGCLPLFAATAMAADASRSSFILPANLVFEFVADRARMIQVSLVFVICGIALLGWRK